MIAYINCFLQSAHLWSLWVGYRLPVKVFSGGSGCGMLGHGRCMWQILDGNASRIPFYYHVVWQRLVHYNDAIMNAIASQITSLTIVYSTIYSDADQRKHQSSTLLAFVWGIHRGPANSSHKWPVTRKMFPFVDVVMVAWRLASLDMGLSLNDSFVSSLTIGFKYLWGYIRAYFRIWHIIFIQHIQHAKDYPNE